MAWYPGARKLELQPESDAQAAIRPTQLIMHSIAAPWTVQRIYEYWRDSSSLESHLGLAYDGDIGQFIGTETRADANMYANRRPDGTGAISIETASNLQHTDPWTDAQVEQLIRLGVWLHQQHGIPLRICRSWDDPGYGYHSLFPQWSDGGTACPGAARIRQFHEVVFPGIVARASGQTTSEEDDMPSLNEIASAVANAAIPQYDEQGQVTGEAPLYLFISGFDIANRRHDRALGAIQARQAAQDAVLKQLLDAAPTIDTQTVVDAVNAAVGKVEAALQGVVTVDVNVHGKTS